jgi:hypothetical protein
MAVFAAASALDTWRLRKDRIAVEANPLAGTILVRFGRQGFHG